MLRCALVVLALVACKGDKPRPPALVQITAAPSGELALIPGTHRVALRFGDQGWIELADGAEVGHPELGKAIALAAGDGGLAEVFLGAMPIVIAGEHHHETVVRITPARIPIELHGSVYEIVTTSDNREAWRYEHEVVSQLAFVAGSEVTPVAPLAKLGPDDDAASPVRRRLCRTPRVLDLDAAGATVYALVTECSPRAPIRVVAYDAPDRAREIRVQSAEQLQLAPAVLAVSRTGDAAIAGIRAPGRLAIARIAAGGTATVTAHLDGVTRVHGAVVADDGAVWVLAFTSAGAVLARDGLPVALANQHGEPLVPEQLAYSRGHGVVVLATRDGARYLLAEHRSK